MPGPTWTPNRFSSSPREQLIADILDRLYRGDTGAFNATKKPLRELVQWQPMRVEDPSEIPPPAGP